MDKLKVAVIGLGAIGRTHVKAYRETGMAEVTALCDADARTLAEQVEAFGVDECFRDYRDLLKTDVAAVSVCVPNSLHHEVTRAALAAGKHVLVEKPMAMNGGEAERMKAAAEAAGKVLQVGMHQRQNPKAQFVRDLVERGVFGEIYHLRTVLIRRRGVPGLGGWFTTRARSGGGALIDIGVHYLDLAMWMAGLWTPARVSAQTYAKFGPRMREYTYVGMWAGPPNYDGVCDVDDYAAGLVRFGRGATMSFEIAWAANAEDEGYIDLLGTAGGTRFVGNDSPVRILTEHQGCVADLQPYFRPARHTGHTAQAGAFVRACRGECPPVATAGQGVIVMKLLDAIYASSESGREVEIG